MSVIPPSYCKRAENVCKRLGVIGTLDRLNTEYHLIFNFKASRKGGYLFLDGVFIDVSDTYAVVNGVSVEFLELFEILLSTGKFGAVFRLLDKYNVKSVKMSSKMPIILVFQDSKTAVAINYMNSYAVVKHLKLAIVDQVDIDFNEIQACIDTRNTDHSDVLFMQIAYKWLLKDPVTPLERFITSDLMDRNVLKIIKQFC